MFLENADIIQELAESNDIFIFSVCLGDLWGPLILCTFLSAILHGSADDPNTNDGGPEFAQVFVMVWIGAMIVTLNSKLLGGNM